MDERIAKRVFSERYARDLARRAALMRPSSASPAHFSRLRRFNTESHQPKAALSI